MANKTEYTGKVIFAAVCFYILGLGFSSVKAQSNNPPEDIRCWVSSQSFTAGLTIRNGEKTMLCTQDGTWIEIDERSAVCVNNGKFFSTGAIIVLKDTEKTSLECSSDGSWNSKSGVM